MTNRTPGVLVLHNKDGRPRYRAWFPNGRAGKKTWLKAVESLEVALEMRRKAIARTAEAPEGALTLQDAIDRVLDRLRATRRPGHVSWFEGTSKVLTRWFGPTTPLDSITPQKIEAFRREKLKEVSASSVLHYRRALSMVYRGNRRLVLRNPIELTDGWPAPRPREPHYFNAEELAKIIARVRRASADDADLLAALYLTGLRRGELGRLTVEDLRLDERVALIDGKTGADRMALAPEAVEVLSRMAARVMAGPLVPLGADHISGVFKKWSKVLDDDRLHAHALRHSFCTELVRRGLSLPVVQRLARHASPIMTTRYFRGTGDDAQALATLTLKRRRPAKKAQAAKKRKPAPRAPRKVE